MIWGISASGYFLLAIRKRIGSGIPSFREDRIVVQGFIHFGRLINIKEVQD